MEIRPVQFNINTKSNEHKHYLEAEGPVDTTGLVKPLPGKGHLVHDNVISAPVYFVKDIAYDIKSLKNGIKGTANDHQLGRLNDVGLQLGGVGIATYLASKTTNPKAKIMEYVGLGAFLTAMNIYPKIAINAPARIIHGYDIGQWYIDDQGRKKSVNQDSNYRPMDLYRGDVKGETLDEIGDRMGIPRDIKNRHEVIKEQTRKNATQSNTLWMLTAGFATPVITALGCYGLENYVISPQLEKARNNKYNKLISEILEKTKEMTLKVSEIEENDLSHKLAKILTNYENHELPEEELNRIIELLTENMGANASEGLRADIKNIIKDYYLLTGEVTEEMINAGKKNITKSMKKILEPILIPTRQEIQEVLKQIEPETDFVKGSTIGTHNTDTIRKALRQLIDSKIPSAPARIPKEHLEELRDNIVDSMMNTMESKKVKVVTKANITKFEDLAKILGDFKLNQKALDKCSSFKFEFAPETVLARSYSKFEKALIKELGISMKEMKKMRESEEYTAELLAQKIEALCSDEPRYKKTFEKLSKIISEMEIGLNGTDKESSNILDLINAMENNYNNTAKRLANIGGFDTTISKLVNQDVATLGNSINSREELFDFFDGIVANKFKMGPGNDINAYARYNAEGVASSKYLAISRVLERYQGVKNSFFRILHTFEVFKRTADPDTFLKTLEGLEGKHQPLSRNDRTYIQSLIKKIRLTMLTATSADHNLKLDLVNNPIFYKDIANSAWAPEKIEITEKEIERFMKNENITRDRAIARIYEESFYSTKAKGYVTDAAKETMESLNNIENGNVLNRFQTYITRFRNLVINSPIDFTKPWHCTDPGLRNSYTQSEKTNMAFFNLVGQNPVDFFQGGSKREYGTKKWFKMVSGVAAGVFAITFLAQACFGKLSNPHNIKKQVNNETSK